MPHGPKKMRVSWVIPDNKAVNSWTDTTFYNSPEWRALRNSFIKRFPLCVHCLLQNLTVAATVVDHVKPISQGGAALDEDNLQSLCESCHNSKSGTESAILRRGGRGC
jgi:5-methylcytosine-specific restriction endonuclease McrA